MLYGHMAFFFGEKWVGVLEIAVRWGTQHITEWSNIMDGNATHYNSYDLHNVIQK